MTPERRTTRVPDFDDRFAAPLRGVGVDGETRCAHYDETEDVVALRFACCDAFYPCHRCHEATAGHPAEVWTSARFGEPSVLCGVCRGTMTWPAYRAAADACPACGAAFNPGCAAHAHQYAEAG